MQLTNAYNHSVVVSKKISMPSVPADYLDRARLNELLQSYSQLPITIIQAPAGFGKTCLAASWFKKTNKPCAWLVLDEEDTAPHRFWTQVVGSLVGAGFLSRDSLSKAQELLQHDEVLLLIDSILVTLEGVEQDITVVLDNSHVLSNHEASGRTFLYFLKHLPCNVRVVLLTRTHLTLRLTKLYVERSIGVITQDELSFTAEEIKAYFAGQKIRLSKEELRTILHHTNGWPLGVSLFLHSHKTKQPSKKRYAPLGPRDLVNLYLTEEVFNRLSAEEYQFLAATCGLDCFSAPLAAYIRDISTQDALSSLNYFVQNGLFIANVYESDGVTWYRYQPLFARAVLDHFLHNDFDGLVAARKRAIEWFQNNADLDESIVNTALLRELPSFGIRKQISAPEQKELTGREQEIMQLVSKGLSTKEIAQMLYISFETAKKHIANSYKKLDAHTRVQALASFNEQYQDMF